MQVNVSCKACIVRISLAAHGLECCLGCDRGTGKMTSTLELSLRYHIHHARAPLWQLYTGSTTHAVLQALAGSAAAL